MTNEELVDLIQSHVNVKENTGLLYQQNKNFIYQLIFPYSKYVEMDDLMQEAYIGLWRAVQHYDSNKECKFLTYAAWKIQSAVQRYCLNNSLTKRIPISTLELIHKYHKFRNDYYNQNNEYPTDQQIIEHLNIKIKRLGQLRQIINAEYCSSLNDVIPGTEDVTIADSIADEFDLENNVVDSVSSEVINQSVWEAVNELDKRSAEIITGQYKDGMTQTEMSELFNVSKQRIGELTTKAYRKLQNNEKIKTAAEFYGYECKLSYHWGVKKFKNIFTSSTEYLALKHIELEEKMKGIGSDVITSTEQLDSKISTKATELNSELKELLKA